MQLIYRLSGHYFGFITNGNLYDRGGKYLGWIERNHVRLKDGNYLGELVDGQYIQRCNDGPPQLLAISRPAAGRLPIAPVNVPQQPTRQPVPGYSDALAELPRRKRRPRD